MERVLSALSGVGTQTDLQFGVVVARAVSITVAELKVGLAAGVAEGNGVSPTQGMSRRVSLESGLRKGVGVKERVLQVRGQRARVPSELGVGAVSVVLRVRLVWPAG